MDVRAVPVTMENSKSSNTDTSQNAVFINWPTGDNSIKHCCLLDGTDISEYEIAFFNPLNMLIENNLWSSEKDISEIEYVSLTEKDFLGFLAKAKHASKTINQFLKNGGIFVIRSNLPKAHIKVRKKTSASIRDYTESVMSVFFSLLSVILGPL